MSDIFAKGGPVLYIILACSLIALTVAIERWNLYRNVKKEDMVLMPQLRQTIVDGKLAAIPPENGGPLSKIWQSLADEKKDWQVRVAMTEGIMADEIVYLESHLYILATVGTIAPLLGLLGTVLGMIHTFGVVAVSGATDPHMLALGISEALYNTAAGLMVTVPSIICYNYLRNRAESLSGVLDSRFKELTDLMRRGEAHAAK